MSSTSGPVHAGGVFTNDDNIIKSRIRNGTRNSEAVRTEGELQCHRSNVMSLAGGTGTWRIVFVPEILRLYIEHARRAIIAALIELDGVGRLPGSMTLGAPSWLEAVPYAVTQHGGLHPVRSLQALPACRHDDPLSWAATSRQSGPRNQPNCRARPRLPCPASTTRIMSRIVSRYHPSGLRRAASVLAAPVPLPPDDEPLRPRRRTACCPSASGDVFCWVMSGRERSRGRVAVASARLA
jgi:hypothetical protein